MSAHDRSQEDQRRDEAGARKIIQYWPIITWLIGYLLASIFAFTALQAHVSNVETNLQLHKEQQVIERRELNDALKEIRTDIKTLLASKDGKQ